MPNRPVGNPYLVRPLLKALRLLETMGEHGQPITLTEIARQQKLPKTTAFRYLQSLAATGFVIQDVRTDRYQIGPRLSMLAKTNLGYHDLTSLTLPHLDRLAKRFGETANLGVTSGYNILYLAIVGGRRQPNAEAVVGERHPMTSTALGKAILAFLPEAEREMTLASPRAEKTARTVLQDSILRRQLKQAREVGYTLERGETEVGMGCVGTPLLDRAGYPIAGLSLTFPERRLREPLIKEAAAELKAASSAISTGLER